MFLDVLKSKPFIFRVILVVAIITAVLAGIVYFFKPLIQKWAQQTLPPQRTPPENIQMSVTSFNSIPPDKLPARFPLDIPIEKETKVLHNDTFIANNQDEYSSRTFISGKTLEENYNLYKTYLIKSGWTILKDKNEENLKIVVAQKKVGQISVGIKKDAAKNEVIVSITLIHYSAFIPTKVRN